MSKISILLVAFLLNALNITNAQVDFIEGMIDLMIFGTPKEEPDHAKELHIAQKRYDKDDALLNSTYSAIQHRYKYNPEVLNTLKDAQRKWMALRDAELELLLVSKAHVPVLILQQWKFQYLSELTIKRVEELNRLTRDYDEISFTYSHMDTLTAGEKSVMKDIQSNIADPLIITDQVRRYYLRKGNHHINMLNEFVYQDAEIEEVGYADFRMVFRGLDEWHSLSQSTKDDQVDAHELYVDYTFMNGRFPGSGKIIANGAPEGFCCSLYHMRYYAGRRTLDSHLKSLDGEVIWNDIMRID
jgi:uncharacterized protein YecT (DUF1311 family)